MGKLANTSAVHMLTASLLMAAACTGVVGSPDDMGGSPSGPGAGSSGARNGSGPSAGPGGVAGPAAASASGAPAAPGSVAAVPMRRLTRFEYAATVRDLLGLDLSPSAQFVPEERVRWLENDADALTLSAVLAEQYLNSAEDLAGRTVAALDKVLPCAPRADDACAATFLRDTGQRALRRPLGADELSALMATYTKAKADGGFRTGIEMTLRQILIAPSFLYRIEVGEPVPGSPGATRPTSWEMASRLSYFLWGTMPDAALADAASRNALSSAMAVRQQAERMLADPRAKTTLANVLRQWLALEEVDHMDKISTAFPDWKATLPPLMRREVDAFLDNAFWGPDGNMAALYTGTQSFINQDLAKLYGASATGAAFQPVQLDATRRSGLLTLVGILGANAGNDATSPTLRGAFVRARVLCGNLPPPPPSVNNQRPPPTPTTTARQRVNQHAADPSCSGCHALIDPIGFGFEKYDGIGKYRETEAGKPVDDSGEVIASSIGRFQGALELTRKVAQSPEASRCVSQVLYRAALGRIESEADGAALDALAASLAGPGIGTLRGLLAGVTQTDGFLYLTKPANGGRP